MRPHPLATVKKSFEDRGKLVDKLVPMVDRMHGDSSDADVRSRLMGLTNKKLLRLYRVEQKVREQFGDRAKLVAAIVEARTKGGFTADDTFKTKLESFPKARLLDMTHQKHGDKPAKLTAEQKTKLRRGRKAIERAKSAKQKRS